MGQYDQQAEALQKMIVAYSEMRSRLDRVDRALGRRYRKTSMQGWLDRVDRDLERFYCRIVRLSMQAGQPRQQRSQLRYYISAPVPCPSR